MRGIRYTMGCLLFKIIFDLDIHFNILKFITSALNMTVCRFLISRKLYIDRELHVANSFVFNFFLVLMNNIWDVCLMYEA